MKKVLIANRGEIACRIVRACGKLGLASVAVYSEADSRALHVELADEAYPIGPPDARESYLRADKLLEVAQQSRADAIHPGYGFLSERASFAEAVQSSGLTWIGPSAKNIADMGDKERARTLATESGVPVVPGSGRLAGPDLSGVEDAAAAVGYPLLVKASAGGGGIGMRRVDDTSTLRATAVATQSMAAKAFGDGSIYLERYVALARHVEVQVFGFGDGRAVHFHERDCSTQRRFQKVIEEGPAPGLPDATRRKMADAALRICEKQRYEGAGTVEFIVDARTFEFYFLEMNTRIQVEHPVTEMNTGYDLVALQIDFARGALAALDQRAITSRGHAIECRIYAENPARHFMPSPGTLERFRLPIGSPEVRIDSGYREGDRITHFYDPLIAKVICHGNDRTRAIERTVEALMRTDIAGIATNVSFLRSTVSHPRFREGDVSTTFIDDCKRELITPDAAQSSMAPVKLPPL
jgi:acetyl/propionyl-CoA carboxylase alpha subunit